MQSQNLSQTYLLILDDVVANVKPEFVNEGVDESMLRIIRQRTEERLRQRGLITDDARDDQAVPSPEGRPATPAQATTGISVKQEGVEEAAGSSARKRPHDGAGPLTKQEEAAHQQDIKLGIPQQDGAADEGHLAAQEAAAALGLDPSAVTGPSVSVPGFGDLIPVQAGTLHTLQQTMQQRSGDTQPQAAAGAGPHSSSSSARRRQRIPQRDGPADDDVGGDDDEAADDDSGSDLSDPAVAGSDEEEQNDDDIANQGFAMYEKVHRAKNRWRVHLRYGVVKINDKEYMFNKALAELLF